MRRLRYSVPYIAGKSLPKDSDPAPRGAGPASCSQRSYFAEFQSTRPCGAGHSAPALKTRGNISIHPPLRGGTSRGNGSRRAARFQSTRPCGAGPFAIEAKERAEGFQSTRPLRGGTPHFWKGNCIPTISIHPPLAGRDRIRRTRADADEFQSTRPLRGGTRNKTLILLSFCISIHPPLAGRDRCLGVPGRQPLQISIHPPLAGRDRCPRCTFCIRWNFNPPAPCGAGHGGRHETEVCLGISIHPPLAGRDDIHRPYSVHCSISIHPPLAGRDISLNLF